ncbi:hypothetical protein BDZ91DRAFT_720114 [Kalaharituber pfeilii]|nr:hypothetical protein BDZ91DRAFT_720114 [Kalaharituber pfeilii]
MHTSHLLFVLPSHLGSCPRAKSHSLNFFRSRYTLVTVICSYSIFVICNEEYLFELSEDEFEDGEWFAEGDVRGNRGEILVIRGI